jgi:hypothetical protein
MEGAGSAHPDAAGYGNDPRLGAEDGTVGHCRRGGTDCGVLGGGRGGGHGGRRYICADEGSSEAGLRLAVPIPYSPVLEDHVFPDRNRIIAGIREVLQGRGSAVAA